MVGTGIAVVRQLTPVAAQAIAGAGEVLYLAADPAMAHWLEQLAPGARSLFGLYRPGVPRRQIYDEMIEEILAPVRRGARVCAVFYGHPGVYVAPSHEAVERARTEGFDARMLPAISAEDCLVADLGVDPGARGWQSHEATSLLLRQNLLDPTAGLVLWQVDALGKLEWDPAPRPAALRALAEFLLELYPPEHEVVFYNASIYPVAGPVVERVRLDAIGSLSAAPAPTLYVPPLPPRPLDEGMAARLGLSPG